MGSPETPRTSHNNVIEGFKRGGLNWATIMPTDRQSKCCQRGPDQSEKFGGMFLRDGKPEENRLNWEKNQSKNRRLESVRKNISQETEKKRDWKNYSEKSSTGMRLERYF